MSRRDNVEARCPRCRLHASLCLCALIPRLDIRTKLVLFIHYSEERKPTNTGRLATLCLPGSEIVVRGRPAAPDAPFVETPERQALLLFPDEGAPSLDTVALDKPVTLIVPDGTWRQAAKVRNRVPGMRAVPCVSLPEGAPTRYRLRQETRERGLATMEAIARALGILEGPMVQERLEWILRVAVERTLWSRGCLADAEVTGGIPEGAVRHEPSRPA